MASSVSVTIAHAVGSKFERRGTLNVGIYATNGVSVTAAQLKLSVIESFTIGSYGGIVYDATIATNKASVMIKAYMDNGTATAAALPELTNATGLSAHVVPFTAMGH